MEETVAVAGVDGVTMDADWRLEWTGLVRPFLFTGREFQSEQVAVQGTDVNSVFHDRRGALDAVLDFELPADRERLGEGRGSNTGLQCIAPEKGPVGSTTR